MVDSERIDDAVLHCMLREEERGGGHCLAEKEERVGRVGGMIEL